MGGLVGLGKLVIVGLGLALVAAEAEAQQDTSAARSEFAVDVALARRGQSAFNNKGCSACHAFGAKRPGPDLAGLFARRDVDWLRRWLRNPTEMLETDSIAVAMLAEYNNTKMPNLRLKDEEIEALLHYMAQQDARSRGGSAP